MEIWKACDVCGTAAVGRRRRVRNADRSAREVVEAMRRGWRGIGDGRRRVIPWLTEKVKRSERKRKSEVQVRVLLKSRHMWRRPRFKSQFQVEIVEPDLLFLVSETGTQVIEGRLQTMLAPYLDGRRTFGEIVEKLEGRAGPLDVGFGLELLAEEGCLAEGDGGAWSGAERFAEMLGVDGEKARERLARCRVGVTAIGDVEGRALAGMLERMGVRVRRRGDFQIVVTDDYLREELTEWNRRAIAENRSWMLVRPVGTRIWIGPIFQMPETACWECLAKRLREHRQAEAWLESKAANGRRASAGFAQGSGERKIAERRAQAGARARRRVAPAVTLESARQAALGIAATEVMKQILIGKNEALWGKLATLDLRTLAWAEHRVLKQKACPACGKDTKNGRAKGARIELQARARAHTSDGGFRSAPPEETFAEFGHHVSPITGIVSWIEARHAESDGAISVYVAEHTFPRITPARQMPPMGFERHSAGKGMTRQQARASALGEALERYSGVFHGDESRRKSTFVALGDRAIHPAECLLFSERQYRERRRRNARGSVYNWVAMPFDEARTIDWTPVWSLTRKEFRYLPTAYCYYGYPLAEDHEFCRADSNGCAAGRNLEEAILQGFLELVERDAVSIWWYNRTRRPGVELGGFGEAYFDRLQERYRSLGRTIDVLDLTGDFEIPVFVAVSMRKGGSGKSLLLGFGAHFDARIAIGRALTEMNQFLPEVRLGRQRIAYDHQLEDTAFLTPGRTMRRRAEDYRPAPAGDLRTDVERCVARARRLGLETLVLDQTRADVGMRVARVIVPGMRSFWARFAPGRLYEVPVRLGWRKRALDEAELNPAHLSI